MMHWEMPSHQLKVHAAELKKRASLCAAAMGNSMSTHTAG